MFFRWRNCILLFLIFDLKFCYSDPTSSVFGRIQSGLKLAGKLLGLDKAREVANLVSETFGKTQKKGDAYGSANIFSHFLKLLGLEPKRLSAIALNTVLFVAQLISTTLAKPPPAILTKQRKLRDGTPLEWILENPSENLQNLIKLAKDPQLPDQILEMIKEKSTDQESGCVQLLICKTSPFLWGMQKALEDKQKTGNTITSAANMLKYMPTSQEVAAFGDICEKKFPSCKLH